MPDSLSALGGMLLASVPVLLISSLVVALMQVYLTRDRIRTLLGAGGVRGYLVALAVGMITPFSAASGLPLAAGLLESGVPLGVVIAFLVTCPLISPVPILTISAAHGPVGGALYMAAVMTLGVLSGLLVDRLKLSRTLPPATLAAVHGPLPAPESETGKARTVIRRTGEMLTRVTPYVLAGMLLALLALRYLPGEVLAEYVGKSSWWALPAAALAGVPITNLVPVLFPVSLVLVHKGVALGVVLTFSMAAAGLKLPESLFLGKLLGPRVLAYVLAMLAMGALGAGYLIGVLGW